VGSLRTALYAYLIAKKKGGNFLLRIEDTDKEREVAGTTEKIIEALEWAGIPPDEGVVLDYNKKIIQKGERGPYIQSERLKTYQRYIVKLLSKGAAYHCFCTPQRLKKLREQQQQNSQPPIYDGKCGRLSKSKVDKMIESGKDFVIRLKVPRDERIEFKDKIFGKMSIDSNTIDDQILIKSDGFPTYHLAVVVDDHLMKISHITRGEEWLPSVPKHILLYQAFGWELPEFIHLPNVLGTGGKKLSKREGDVAVEKFRQKGYLPEALINFLALLGWNPKSEQEHFSLEELINKFDENGLHKAGAIFDYKKLDWMNAHYIKQKSHTELLELCQPYLKKYLIENKFKADDKLLKKIIQVEQERIKKLSDITENIDFYFSLPKYDKGLLSWKEMGEKELLDSLARSLKIINGIENESFELETIKERLFEEAGDDKGSLLWPLRVALSGEKQSSSPFEIAWVIGRDESLNRIKKAIAKIKN
jgi:nondiscriminating glutamyl-tRNA synthetase